MDEMRNAEEDFHRRYAPNEIPVSGGIHSRAQQEQANEDMPHQLAGTDTGPGKAVARPPQTPAPNEQERALREELLRARLDEYQFIAQMISGVEKEDWYKRRIGYLEAALTTPEQHGVNCTKVPHTRDGYLHDENDDRPYDVDGQTYCGRCHVWLGGQK